MSSRRSATEWVSALSPWPKDGFGLERMRALLAGLGDPQLRYPAVHVVGTNGKSTTARMTEELLADAGLAVGTYLSPHVRGWSERIRIRGEEADFEQAIAAIRPQAEAHGATQFESVTAAALLAFAEAGVDAAVVEAGLGGRHDATNVLESRVVVLTNVALEHTDVLGGTREAIAAEKLAVVQPGSTAVIGEVEWKAIAEENGAAAVVVAGGSNLALAVAAAESFLGRTVDPHVAEDISLPGRLDKRPELMLRALSVLGGTLVATESSSIRALAAADLASLAEPYFEHVEAVADPADARRRGLDLAGPDGAVLVAGSLYLLADLNDAGYNQ